MKLVVSVLIFIFISAFQFFAVIPHALANTNYQLPVANRIANSWDKLIERATLFFKFSDNDRFDYQKLLAEKRLSELKFVIDSGKGDLIEETSSRYSSYIGRLNNFVMSKRLVDKRQDLQIMQSNHLEILQELSDKFEFDSGFWLLLQHDINTIKIHRDQLKNVK